MPALIEEARKFLQSKEQAEEAAKTRVQEVTTIHQLYKGMHSDCMSILRSIRYSNARFPTGTLLFGKVPVLGGIEESIAFNFGPYVGLLSVTRTWKNDEGRPIEVQLSGHPYQGKNSYASLEVEGLPGHLHLEGDPKRCSMPHFNGKEWRDITAKDTKLSQVQDWRKIVDFLKASQKPR